MAPSWSPPRRPWSNLCAARRRRGRSLAHPQTRATRLRHHLRATSVVPPSLPRWRIAARTTTARSRLVRGGQPPPPRRRAHRGPKSPRSGAVEGERPPLRAVASPLGAVAPLRRRLPPSVRSRARWPRTGARPSARPKPPRMRPQRPAKTRTSSTPRKTSSWAPPMDLPHCRPPHQFFPDLPQPPPRDPRRVVRRRESGMATEPRRLSSRTRPHLHRVAARSLGGGWGRFSTTPPSWTRGRSSYGAR